MKNYVKIGRLEAVRLRDVWKDEAYDFTPWLALDENIDILGDVIGKQLTVESVETSVGRYFADIVCRDEDENIVLIENQLTRTDHKHLGQICTYAAGLNAKTIIWIAESIAEEHREAVDWLNSISNDDVEFYAVGVKAMRIGDSSPAPLFELSAQPALFSRAARRDMKQQSEKPRSELQLRKSKFWAECIKIAARRIDGAENRAAYYKSYQTFSSLTYKQIRVNFIACANTQLARVEAYFRSDKADVLLEALMPLKASIETEYGSVLQFECPENAKYVRIADYHPAGEMLFAEGRAEQQAWFINKLEVLIASVRNHVSKIDMNSAAQRIKDKP